MIQWLIDNWFEITIPVVAFFATCVVGLWLRRVADNAFERLTAKWQGSRLVRVSGAPPLLILVSAARRGDSGSGVGTTSGDQKHNGQGNRQPVCFILGLGN